MALKSFRIENVKALRLAECEDVPPIMVIAGPNGIGKSTLLFSLHRKQGAVLDPETTVIYQPPHRAIRRQQVQRRYLGGAFRSLGEIFGGMEVSGFDGLQIPFPARAPDNVDEAGSTIKYTLGKIENRRQAVLAKLVDEHAAAGLQVDAPSLADIYGPLRKLTSTLLPHQKRGTGTRVGATESESIAQRTRSCTDEQEEAQSKEVQHKTDAVHAHFQGLPVVRYISQEVGLYDRAGQSPGERS